MKIYKIICIVTSVLFFILFLQLFLIPGPFVTDLGLEPSVATSVLGRRASIFMLGISILLFCSNCLSHSKARQFICLSTGITLVGLACMGTYEYFMKTVNSSIFIAIVIETILGFSFFLIFFKNRKVKIIQ